jgi:murein L,D-transpeptidase YafK
MASLSIVLAITFLFMGPPSPAPEHADRIVVTKSTHTMQLFAHGRVIRAYSVALGRSSGKKLQQGDHKTPEGLYTIDERNQQSRFHLALHVSYPNANDRSAANAAHVAPGGDIMIHGLPPYFAWAGKLQSHLDWTDGCIAVDNAEIEEIWKLVPNGTPVEIEP